jgi:DNA excision repair protein ERCC-3
MESSHPETLQLLLKDDTIRNARIVSMASNTDNGVKTFGVGPSKHAIPETSAQAKDINTNSAVTRQSDAELFTSVVGVEVGKCVLLDRNLRHAYI